MTKRLLLIGIIILTTVVFLKRWRDNWSSEKNHLAQNIVTNEVSSANDVLKQKTEGTRPAAAQSQKSPPSSGVILTSQAEKVEQFLQSQNRQLSFFGRVLDQHDLPVMDAEVTATARKWVVHPNQSNDITGMVIRLVTTTDATGNFQFDELSGDSVQIEKIEKEGHELSRKGKRAFSSPQISRENPIVFRMWQKTVKGEGVVFGEWFSAIIPDGRVYTFDLVNKKTLESDNSDGDFRLAVNRPSGVGPRDRYDWTVSLIPIDGGILTNNFEFAYAAPLSGYLTSFVRKIEVTDPDWRPRIEQEFFLRSKNGSHVASIDLEIFSEYNDNGAINVRFTINTNGSHNLQR